MKPRTAAIIACRVIALFLGVEALTALISFLIISREFAGSGSFWAYLGTRLVVAFALWIVADRVADVMTRDTEDAGVETRPLFDAEVLAFTIVGVVLIVQAIPNLIQVAASGGPTFGEFSPLSFPGYFGDRSGAVAGEITRLGLGVALILGARSLASALRRRDGGQPPAA